MSDNILQDENLNQIDVLFQELPTRAVRHQITKPHAKLEVMANKIKKRNTTHKEIGKI